jgi:hypothetical protein
MVCDFNDMYFTTVDTSKATNCPACKGKSSAALQEKLVWVCGQNTANINPEKPLKLNLEEASETIRKLFKVRLKSHLAIIFYYGNLEVSLFNGGRMLIKNVPNEAVALKAYKKILKKIGIT